MEILREVEKWSVDYVLLRKQASCSSKCFLEIASEIQLKVSSHFRIFVETGKAKSISPTQKASRKEDSSVHQCFCYFYCKKQIRLDEPAS